MKKDELFETGDQERIWQKYCGFLDLSLQEFMEIQEQLLMEQIELVYDSPLAKKFMSKKPKDMTEFRQLVPLTTYDDYADYLSAKNEDVLATKPDYWACTSGKGGASKWVPYTHVALERLSILSTASSILSCTDIKGEVNIGKGVRVLHNLPLPPYITGILARLATDNLDIRYIPSLEDCESIDFEARTQAGFQIALRTGVDILSSLTSVLLKIGQRFSEGSGQMRFSRGILHPQVMWRLIRAKLICKREGRSMLPKDLWPLKGLLCYGTDTAIYREQIMHYWGKEPLETYGSTEAGLIAASAWNKKDMVFIPLCCFLEFATEEEWLKSRENEDYQPATILLDEVEPGKRYEVIITSFYGMPFLRYRIGDLIKVVALEDDESGIKLPQMVFESRTDDLIDIAGFSRLDEKTIWQTIADTGIQYEDWSARKEYKQDQPIMHLYIELKQEMKAQELERIVHQKLADKDNSYRDLESVLGIWPLKVTILPVGSFQRYYEEKKAVGAELAHLKPPHMNATNAVIQNLLGKK